MPWNSTRASRDAEALVELTDKLADVLGQNDIAELGDLRLTQDISNELRTFSDLTQLNLQAGVEPGVGMEDDLATDKSDDGEVIRTNRKIRDGKLFSKDEWSKDKTPYAKAYRKSFEVAMSIYDDKVSRKNASIEDILEVNDVANEILFLGTRPAFSVLKDMTTWAT